MPYIPSSAPTGRGKIGDLTETLSVTDADVLEIETSGTSKKVAINTLRSSIQALLPFGNPDTAYEFSTSSLAGLTATTTTPTTENANTTVPGHYYVADANAGVKLVGRYITPPSTPYTAIARLAGCAPFLDFSASPLFIGEATPGKTNFLALGTASAQIHANYLTDLTTFDSNFYSGPTGVRAPIHIAVRVNSATSTDWLFTIDGTLWTKAVSARNPGFTIGSLGVGHKCQNAANFVSAWDWLRVWNSALTFPGE